MNYPSELEKILEEHRAEEWRNKKRHCQASEEGGCFCTGWCENKEEIEKAFEYTGVQEMKNKIT